jgi:hypothetical protein
MTAGQEGSEGNIRNATSEDFSGDEIKFQKKSYPNPDSF